MTQRLLAALSPVLALSFAISLPTHGQQASPSTADSGAPVHTAAEALTLLKGKPLFLRGCWSADKLSFNSSGQPADPYPSIPFTLSAFDLRSAKLNGTVLQLDGDRVGIEFDKQRLPKRVPLTEGGIFKMKQEHITIRIDVPSDGDFSQALHIILAEDLNEMANDLPPWWSPLAASLRNGTTLPHVDDTKSMPAPGLLQVGGNVKPPKLLNHVDPTFSEAAQRLKFSGDLDIYLIVETDGTPTHIRIAKPLGLGLDEEALAAVSKYRFAPATKNGVPVKVDMYVDINFQIF